MVADFMTRAREILADGVDGKSLSTVGRLLAQVSAEPGFIPQTQMKSLHGGDTRSAVLQSDPDGLTLMLGHFSAKEETPVHNHSSWGIACVVQGRDRYRHWHHDDEGLLKILYEKDLGPGDFVTWLDPPHDIHSQQGIGDPALELVLFGKNTMAIPRTYYNPETGEVRTALPQ
jgi:predicted metal-dependent enzyme (double-stranded beta helix superfamily)